MTETTLDTQLSVRSAGRQALGAIKSALARSPLLRHVTMLTLWAFVWIAVIAVPILIYAGGIYLVGNIDTVVKGKVYRSATLSAPDLAALIRAGHIRTVINLRGTSPGQSWYEDERRVTSHMHVQQIDLALSAIHQPSPELLAKLVETLKTAETPMLIHCSSGSDRTGLASAIYDYVVLKQPADVARQQLSFYWGHFPWLGSPTIAMDRTFDRIVDGEIPPPAPQ